MKDRYCQLLLFLLSDRNSHLKNIQVSSIQKWSYRGSIYSNSNFYQKKKPACTKCKQEGKEDSCNHCFGCGSKEHFKQNCPQRKSQTQGNESGLSRRGTR